MRGENLKKAVGRFTDDCERDIIDCDNSCPLNRPVNEHSEHPTFCELLYEVDEKYRENCRR